MFQILKDTRIDFMGTRKIWLTISAVLVVASILILAVKGIDWGIEFTGGTQIQVRFASAPDIARVRQSLRGAGLGGAQVTQVGRPEEREIEIRIPSSGKEGEGAGLITRVKAALRPPEVAQRLAEGAVDINEADQQTLESLLSAGPALTTEQARSIAAAILERRKIVGTFRGADDIAGLPSMTPEVLSYLKARTFPGPFAIRQQSYIGPTIGRELVRKAGWAVLGSLVGMLIYIWFRFRLDMGIAAVAALIHDTIVTLGLFALFDKEMSLPVVAAFLTLIGYSVNDTVVIFDRIRENLAERRGIPLHDLINLSVNQTLSRTILTSLLTWLVTLSLFFFGGEVLNPFSFVLVVGIVVGSYSTIYIASPILVASQRWMARRRGETLDERVPAAAAPPSATARKATKVRKPASDRKVGAVER